MKLNNLNDNYIFEDDEQVTFAEIIDQYIYFGQYTPFREILNTLRLDSLLELLDIIDESAQNFREIVKDHIKNNFTRHTQGN